MFIFFLILGNFIQCILIVFFPIHLLPDAAIPTQLQIPSLLKTITERTHTRKYSIHFVLVNCFRAWAALEYVDGPVSPNWSKRIFTLLAAVRSFLLKWGTVPASFSPCRVFDLIDLVKVFCHRLGEFICKPAAMCPGNRVSLMLSTTSVSSTPSASCSAWINEHWGRGVIKTIGGWVLQSLSLSLHCPFVSLCRNCHLLQEKELLWWGLNDPSVYGHSNVIRSNFVAVLI